MQPKLITKIDKTFDEQDEALGVVKYSDAESRDERGRWTTSGTGDAAFGGAKTGDRVSIQHFQKSDGYTTTHHATGTVDGYSKGGKRLHLDDGTTYEAGRSKHDRVIDNSAPDSPKEPVMILSHSKSPSTIPEIDRATYGNSGAEHRWATHGGPPSMYD